MTHIRRLFVIILAPVSFNFHANRWVESQNKRKAVHKGMNKHCSENNHEMTGEQAQEHPFSIGRTLTKTESIKEAAFMKLTI